jgi:hypothetical protein
METKAWHSRDKSKWGPGAWQDEPDKMQWPDEATGLPCLIVRNRLGALCGYVGVPETHAAYGLNYDGTPSAEFQERIEQTRKRFPIITKLTDGGADFGAAFEKAMEGVPERDEPVGIGKEIAGVSVHGGLTYASPCQKFESEAEQQLGEPDFICHTPSPGEPDNVWWFGFDTAHAWDYVPGMVAQMREVDSEYDARRAKYNVEYRETYRGVAFVQNECRDLARQLAGMTLLLTGPDAERA